MVDGGSSEIFLKQFAKFSYIIIDTMHIKKRSPKKQRAFVIASKLPGVKAIVSVEAEKVGFIDSLPQLARPLVTNETDIVVPKREIELFKESYPDFQFISETQANKEYNATLIEHNLLPENHEDLDILFGPVAFRNSPEIVKLFLQRVKFRKYEDGIFPSVFHDPDQYSNAYFFPTIMALQKNMRVKSVSIPFRYPKIQRENEEQGNKEEFIEKRKLQSEGILSNLHDFLRFKLKE